ncbi:cryptochrome/photolyase family protein [Hellea balneolensis]|uniref:cryptochrome/photolyase family protein n=1 Tax=Hellea balneolensis TaxID=287478 RepID=UPI0004100FF4|nr:cryptochrome/photolyase family protein [Hellea balneolensis]
MSKILIPIFADQLSHGLAPLEISSPEDCIILMMEVRGEADTVPHHRKKLIFLFSAMRHFADELKERGWSVDYIALNDVENTGNFTSEIKRAMSRHDIEQIRLCEPSEYRVLETVKSWQEELSIPTTIMPDHRFIADHDEFETWAEGRKQYRMEFFYREMRRKTNLLMEGDKPEGGKWNYDSENRKPAKGDLFMPKPLKFKPDSITQDVINMVETEFPNRFGATDDFFFAVTRDGAKEALAYFIKNVLPRFGDYQDAMLTGEPFLYHSLLSMYLNAGLLGPLEICEVVETAYKDGKAPLNAAEGYIRQIIGWREYVRGIYWLKMPDYVEENALGATRDLPEFYWTGETDMQCLSQAIGQTKEHAYAHHIQRLMITGNFALLIGVDPKQLHEWYLAVYIDAFEWVELPNTLGMSQFGDGGLLGSKPYASSGAYINRMSNYCSSCKYSVKERVGEKACPFNSLYWHFIARNEEALAKNNRMAMPYRNLAKMDQEKREALITQADTFLDNLMPTEGTYF